MQFLSIIKKAILSHKYYFLLALIVFGCGGPRSLPFRVVDADSERIFFNMSNSNGNSLVRSREKRIPFIYINRKGDSTAFAQLTNRTGEILQQGEIPVNYGFNYLELIITEPIEYFPMTLRIGNRKSEFQFLSFSVQDD